jgi:uncharacterized UBP type Zn finger protein
MSSTNEKKRSICPRCAKAEGNGDEIKIRSCDEEGCGRHHCQHLGVRKDGKDCCGPCNLKKARKAAGEKPPAPPKVEEPK